MSDSSRNLFYEQLEQQSEGKTDLIRQIIDDAVKHRDRSVSIFFTPTNGMPVAVYPWPDGEDLYAMYQRGEINFNDFRAKMGLSMMKEEDFLREKLRSNTIYNITTIGGDEK